MSQNSSALAMFLNIMSFICGGVGLIFGIIIMMNSFPIGMMMIFVTVMFSIILYALGRLTGMLVQLQASSYTARTYPQKEEGVSGEEQGEQTAKEKGEAKQQEWTLTEEERKNIHQFYEQNDHRIEEIITTPYHRYCVIKAEDFIDVIELENKQPVTMTRSQVEALPALRDWIQETLFN